MYIQYINILIKILFYNFRKIDNYIKNWNILPMVYATTEEPCP